jgi:hypothetical protein
MRLAWPAVWAAAVVAAVTTAGCSTPAWSTLQGTVTATCGAIGAVPQTAPVGGNIPVIPCKTAPITGANVLAVNHADGSLHTTKTDAQGRFSMNVPGGDYEIYLGITTRPSAQVPSQARATVSGYPGEKVAVAISVKRPVMSVRPIVVSPVPSR